MMLDILYIIIILIFTLLGYKNGFIKEVFNLVKIFFVIYIIPLFISILSVILKIDLENNLTYKYISYIFSFLILYIIFTILVIIINKFMSITPLSFINKILGLFFGLVKSSIIIFVVFIILLIGSDYRKDFKEYISESEIVEYMSVYLSPYNALFPEYIKDKLDKFKNETEEKRFKNQVIEDIEKGRKYE